MSYKHLKDTRPKGRKPHRCYLCNEMIEAGTVHVLRAGINEGNFDSIRMHAECEQATQGWDEDTWECFSQGDLDRPGGVPRPEPATDLHEDTHADDDPEV